MGLLVRSGNVISLSQELDLSLQDHDWTALLACPKCHGELQKVDAPEGFGCQACSLFFAVDDGLPNMLIDEAGPWPAKSAAVGD